MNIKNETCQSLIKAEEIPTRKQLEREIAHSFHGVYKQKLGHSPQKVSCSLFGNYLILIAEEAVTPLEFTIEKSGHEGVLFEMRHNLNRILKAQLQKLLESIISVEIIDLTCDLNYESHRLMAIAIFKESPHLRSKKQLSSTKLRISND